MYIIWIVPAFLVFIGLWHWFLWMNPVRKHDNAPFWAVYVMQISLAFAALSFIAPRLLWFAVLPPLLLFNIFWPTDFMPFLVAPILSGFGAGVVAAIVLFQNLSTRRWSPALSMIVGFIAFSCVAEFSSTRSMCSAAQLHDFEQVQRHTFIWSMRNTPREFQLELHAVAYVDRRRFGWSYSELDFYEIQPSVSGDVTNGKLLTCPVTRP